MQNLFVSHANVFDENVQDFILQNFIQEASMHEDTLCCSHDMPSANETIVACLNSPTALRHSEPPCDGRVWFDVAFVLCSHHQRMNHSRNPVGKIRS